MNEDGVAPPDPNEKEEPWPQHAMKWFSEVKDDIGDAIIRKRIKDGGKIKGIFEGNFPLKYYGIVTPSDNPLALCGTTTAVEQGKFCLPDTFVWFVEAQWPTLQPARCYHASGMVQLIVWRMKDG